MTHPFIWMAIEALFAAIVTAVVVRILVVRLKQSARTFTLRDASGRQVAKFTLGDEEDYVSVMEREVSRLEFKMPFRPTSS
jgi:hypothetical protein